MFQKFLNCKHVNFLVLVLAGKKDRKIVFSENEKIPAVPDWVVVGRRCSCISQTRAAVGTDLRVPPETTSNKKERKTPSKL